MMARVVMALVTVGLLAALAAGTGERRAWAAPGVWADGGDDSDAKKDKSGKADEADDESSGKQKQEHVVLDSESHKYPEWRLPQGYKNPDGTFNQEVLVAHQKKRLPVMNQKLTGRFELRETPHFLIFSDCGAQMDRVFAKWAEALYANLGRKFRIDLKDQPWDGKCIYILTRTRSMFLAQAREFDNFHASFAGAYFCTELDSPNAPKLVHIAIPCDSFDERRLQELFAHETAHAFFQLYRKNIPLPTWLHEGIAEFMTVVNDRDLHRVKKQYAVQYARNGIHLDDMFRCRGFFGYPYYNVSYTMVDFLTKISPTKFKAFIDGIKDGKDQEVALREAYGWTFAQLEANWRAYVMKFLTRG